MKRTGLPISPSIHRPAIAPSDVIGAIMSIEPNIGKLFMRVATRQQIVTPTILAFRSPPILIMPLLFKIGRHSDPALRINTDLSPNTCASSPHTRPRISKAQKTKPAISRVASAKIDEHASAARTPRLGRSPHHSYRPAPLPPRTNRKHRFFIDSVCIAYSI
jgi:hypothetical protein